MQSLNKEQLEMIVSDVENARITFSHLADELIDHICCEVEHLIGEGKSFDEAYEIVKQQTGIKVLQKIQESTLYLIDKKYRRMKTTMKITGNLSLAMLGIGTVMKLFHWQGGSLLLMLGFTVLCLIFFPSAIYTNYKETKIKGSIPLHLSILIGGILFMAGVLFKVLHLRFAAELLFSGWVFILFIFLPILLYVKLKEALTSKEKLIIILGILGLIIFELSTMYKLFHFKGAATLMIVGSILLITIFLPLYTYSKFKETKEITGQYIYILISTMFFILFSVLLALNVSVNILGVFSNEENNSAQISSYLELKNQKLYADFNEKADSTKKKQESKIIAIREGSKNLCSKIDSIKVELIMAAEQIDKQSARNLILDVSSISKKSDIETGERLMLGDENNGMAYQLKLNLKKYQEIALSVNAKNQDLNKNINNLINISDYPNQTWEQYSFSNNALISTIAVLTDIEKRVRMVESQSVQQIIY